MKTVTRFDNRLLYSLREYQTMLIEDIIVNVIVESIVYNASTFHKLTRKLTLEDGPLRPRIRTRWRG